MQLAKRSWSLPCLAITLIVNGLAACSNSSPAESTATGGQSASGGSNSGGATQTDESKSTDKSTGTGGSSKTASSKGTGNGGSAANTRSSATEAGGTTDETTDGSSTGGTSARKSSSGSGMTGGASTNSGSAASGGATSTGGSSNATGGTSTADGGSTGDGTECPSVSEFETWSAGKGPAEIGKAAVENFKPRTSETYGGDGYAWTFGYVGSLQFTQVTGDSTNNDYLVSKFDCSQDGPDNSATASVDTRAFGVLPLEIFIEKGTAACKSLGLARADAQWQKTTSDGITSDARYWIDDMYMITSLQVYAYRATKDSKYLDRAAKTMLAYIAALQQSKDGLFWHTKQSKAYWGRANGWVASGMTELLLDLPAGANRTSILEAFTKQMDGLLAVQIASGTDAGAWRQVLDRTDAKPEMSSTAMFTFALATGVKNGWLKDAKYATAAVNGWKALASRTNSSGQLDQICPGTGQAPAGDLASQQKFYMDIAFQPNDRHGQGPELWAATALLRKDCPGLR